MLVTFATRLHLHSDLLHKSLNSSPLRRCPICQGHLKVHDCINYNLQTIVLSCVHHKSTWNLHYAKDIVFFLCSWRKKWRKLFCVYGFSRLVGSTKGLNQKRWTNSNVKYDIKRLDKRHWVCQTTCWSV